MKEAGVKFKDVWFKWKLEMAYDDTDDGGIFDYEHKIPPGVARKKVMGAGTWRPDWDPDIPAPPNKTYEDFAGATVTFGYDTGHPLKDGIRHREIQWHRLRSGRSQRLRIRRVAGLDPKERGHAAEVEVQRRPGVRGPPRRAAAVRIGGRPT